MNRNFPRIVIYFYFCFCSNLFAQESRPILRDTFDNKFDVSSFLVDMNGFIPVASIITEPALGSFGFVVAPVFISPQRNKSNTDRFHFPDITAAFGMYTLNNSWGVGVFRMGSIPKYGLRYRIGGAYASINMNFYRTLPLIGEKEFGLHMEVAGLLLECSKNIYRNRVFTGLNYSIANTLSGFTNTSDKLDKIFSDKEMKSTIANLGVFVELDYRNSIFTADKGVRLMATYLTNGEFTGSDFTFNRLNLLLNAYVQPTSKWVAGFRSEASAITDGAPFYAKPFIVMRGIPIMRYQGDQILLFETEQRFDLDSRWSLVAFAGTGKAFNSNAENWNWAGGTGFRYLLSRLFKIRAGVDIARGPEVFAYYIVFGHNWNR